ncbi:Acyl-CoA Delta(11) desaturase [Halotydeus destructor]|nr:Acyl-CoA Delta(11) desaturase [Halotydeus destructor]
MGRIRWLMPTHVPLKRDEWAIYKTKSQEYYYVDNGFFKVHNNINNIVLTGVHLVAIYGFYVLFTYHLWPLWFICMFYVNLCIVGLTAGSHRLWAHKSYKARFPLRLFLMLCQTCAGIWSLRTWYVNHTTHHKYSDTDGDPHNASRGLFFAHGWFVFMKQHPVSWLKSQAVDTSKVMKDVLVRFQYDNFELIYITVGVALPTLTGMYFGHDPWPSFLICYCCKHVIVSQMASLLNSAAHAFGDKPYQVSSKATDNPILSWFVMGEGYHNFHHAFPMDYATGEYGSVSLLTKFIELMEWCGQAYDLKRSSDNVHQKTKLRIAGQRKTG